MRILVSVEPFCWMQVRDRIQISFVCVSVLDLNIMVHGECFQFHIKGVHDVSGPYHVVYVFLNVLLLLVSSFPLFLIWIGTGTVDPDFWVRYGSGPGPFRANDSQVDPCGSATSVVDPDPHWFWSASSMIAIMTHKKVKKFLVLSSGFSLLRAGGFSCSLDVLYGGLEKKIVVKFAIFFHQIAGSGSGTESRFELKPKHCP